MKLLFYYKELVTNTSKTGWNGDCNTFVLYERKTPVRRVTDNGKYAVLKSNHEYSSLRFP
jgi:hypothetical protein